MIYIVQCLECSAKEEYLGNMKYFPAWLKSHKCGFCGGTLEKIPSSPSFTIKDGTPKFHGGEK